MNVVHVDFSMLNYVVGTFYKKYSMIIEFGAIWVETEKKEAENSTNRLEILQNKNSMIEGYSIGTMIDFSQFN